MSLNRSNSFKIIDINWERIFLNIKVQADSENKSKFVLAKVEESLSPKQKGIRVQRHNKIDLIVAEQIEIIPDVCENGVYSFVLNTTAINKGEFLDNGQWMVAAVDDNEFYPISISTDLGYKTDELSRVFRYGRGKYAYNVSFSYEDNLELLINSYFMIMNNKWKKRRYIQEAFHLPGKLNRTYMFAAIRGMRIFYRCLSILNRKTGKKILFMSETKDYLWGNLKFIHDRLYERGLDKEFDITVSCRKSVGHHKSIMSWVKTVSRLAKNDYIFIDDYAPIFGFIKLSPKTKLIQVWHAGEGFKSVGYSRFGKSGSPFPSDSCHKSYDYASTGSKRLIHVYEEVFGLKKEAFLPVGMPRLDGFLDEDRINTFRTRFYGEHPELEGKKIILFAPTFRGVGQRDAYYDYDKLDLKEIYEVCGEEYVFLIKMHPFVEEKIKIAKEYSDRIIDFTSYPDINELYYITDLLITDYSSNYYEFALMRKPALFYTYDRESYELTRGVHRSVKECAPGKVCDTFDELIDAIKNRDFEEYKMKQFIEENFGEYDGHACDKVIDRILLKKEN